MRRCLSCWLALLFVVSAGLAARRAAAGPLDGAILITHLNPSIQYTTSTPSYDGQSNLSTCAEALVQGAVGEERAQVWYVMAALHDSPGPLGLKAVEFGLGDYNASCLAIADFGHCLGSNVQQITTMGWPGPREGIALAIQGDGFAYGDLVEVYWFATYVYCPAVVPLDVNPTTGATAVLGVTDPQDLVYAENRGSIGFGQVGYNPCGGGPAEPTGACCMWDDRCEVLEEAECEAEGGVYQGDFTGCLPNPCDRPAIETSWGILKKLYE